MTHVAAPGGNGISDVKDEDSAAGLPRRRTQFDFDRVGLESRRNRGILLEPRCPPRTLPNARQADRTALLCVSFMSDGGSGGRRIRFRNCLTTRSRWQEGRPQAEDVLWHKYSEPFVGELHRHDPYGDVGDCRQ